jgi:uroporphyrinogen-III synthase
MGEMNSSALAGKRVVVTRAAEQSMELVQALTSRGAILVLIPLLSFAAPEDSTAMDAAISELAQFECVIFTSVNAVRAVAARAEALGCRHKLAESPKIAAVGPATAKAAREAGFRVAHVATAHNGVALAHELGELVRDKKIFLPRSDRANPDLPVALRQYDAQVSEVVAYRTVAPSDTDKRKWKEVLDSGADAILFFSPSAVIHLTEQLAAGQLLAAQDRIALVAIGPVTAKALREAGVKSLKVARDTTPVAAVEALEGYFTEKEKQMSAGVKQK